MSHIREARNPPEITALATDIQRTIEKIFGENTSDSKRYELASSLEFRPMSFGRGYPAPQHYRSSIQANLLRSSAILEEAIKSLLEDKEDLDQDQALEEKSEEITKNKNPAYANKIFVVHGHDEAAREIVARFLEKIGFEAIILHEQANKGRTIIEKFEAHGNVGFVVVLLTPDDQGCEAGGTPRPRARQNVVLELGYFVGRLGRERVVALRKGEVEIPSDFSGVVYETLDAGGAWKATLGRELKAAGYEIDWNKVMGL